MDPARLQLIFKFQATGPLRIGHTRDFGDPAEPIMVREADDVLPGPGGVSYAEGRCPDCVAHPVISRGEHQTLLVLEHEPGCPVMAALLAERRAGS
jgi:hypothetical protein